MVSKFGIYFSRGLCSGAMLVFRGVTNLLTGDHAQRSIQMQYLALARIENGHLFADCHDEPWHVHGIFCIKLLYFRFSIEVEMKSTLHVYIINNRLSWIINAFQFATGWKTGLPSLSKSLWWKATFAFLHPKSSLKGQRLTVSGSDIKSPPWAPRKRTTNVPWTSGPWIYKATSSSNYQFLGEHRDTFRGVPVVSNSRWFDKKSSQRQVDLNFLQRHRLRKSSKNPQTPKDQRLDPPMASGEWTYFSQGFFWSSKWRQAFEGSGHLGQTGKKSSKKSSNGPNWNP